MKHHFHKMKGNQPFTQFVEHRDNDFSKLKKFNIKNMSHANRKFYKSLEKDYGTIKLDLPLPKLKSALEVA